MNAQLVRTILTGFGMAGVGATAMVSAMDAHNAPKMEDKSPKGICTYVWQNHKKTLIVGTTTVVCVGASHKIGTKQVAAIAATAAGVRQLYSRYEYKLEEVLGSEKVDEIKKEFMKDRAKENLSNQPKMDHEEEAEYFYEPITDQWFYSTREKILSAQNKLNYKFIHDPDDFESKDNECVMAGVYINDWLKAIGCKKAPKGLSKIGWFWGDGDAYWDYNWGFFGGPWISVEFSEIYEGNDKYTMLEYGPMPPTFADSEGAVLPYQKELSDAKMRWENEYA